MVQGAGVSAKPYCFKIGQRCPHEVEPDAKLVFVLMPFAAEFDDVYELGILPACQNAGAFAQRVDKQIFHERILERIYNQISKADIVVSDMSGRNENVFYETGYAHALGKPVILLTRDPNDIPFDLKDFQHIVYHGRIVDLVPKLERHVRWVLQHPSEPVRRSSLRYQVSDTPMDENSVIDHRVDGPITSYRLNVDIQNPIERDARSSRFYLGVLTSGNIGWVKAAGVAPKGLQSVQTFGMTDYGRRAGVRLRTVKMPEGTVLHRLDELFDILPGDWASLQLTVSSGSRRKFEPNSEHHLILRSFLETGYSDLPFVVRLVLKEKPAIG